MSRPATITVGDDGSTAIRVEYVPHRRALRLWGCDGRPANAGPVEVSVQALVELGVDAEELVSPRRFLLFGGEGAVRGGARDLIATYDSEALARAAFIDLRRAGNADWAELVAVSARGLKRLAWFGPRPTGLLPVPPTVSVLPRERGKHMQATETVRDSKPVQPSPRRPRSTRLRLIVAGVLTAAAAGGVVGAHALTHSSPTPAHVVAPLQSGAAIDTDRTTVVPPETHTPIDASADQAQFTGPGGD